MPYPAVSWERRRWATWARCSRLPINDWLESTAAFILAECVRMALARGWVVTHLDATIVAQRPKLAGHLGEMSIQVASDSRISRLLQ